MKKIYALLALMALIIVASPQTTQAQIGRAGSTNSQAAAKKAEAERKAAAERQRQEQARRDREAAERQRREEQARRDREAAERQRREEQARRDREEAERQRQEAQARRDREAAERQRQEAQARRDREEAERQRQEAQARRDREEAERQRREAQARRDREEAEQQRREAQAQRDREAAERQRAEEQARREAEEERARVDRVRREQEAAAAQQTKPTQVAAPASTRPTSAALQGGSHRPAFSSTVSRLNPANAAIQAGSRGGADDVLTEYEGSKIPEFKPPSLRPELTDLSPDTTLGTISGSGSGSNSDPGSTGGNTGEPVYVPNPYIPGSTIIYYPAGGFYPLPCSPPVQLLDNIEATIIELQFLLSDPYWDDLQFRCDYQNLLSRLSVSIRCLPACWNADYYWYEHDYYERMFAYYENQVQGGAFIPDNTDLYLDYLGYYEAKAGFAGDILPDLPSDSAALLYFIDTAFGDNWGGYDYYEMMASFNPDDVRAGMTEGSQFDNRLGSNQHYLVLQQLFTAYSKSAFLVLLHDKVIRDHLVVQEVLNEDTEYATYIAVNMHYLIKAILMMVPEDRRFLQLKEDNDFYLHHLNWTESEE